MALSLDMYSVFASLSAWSVHSQRRDKTLKKKTITETITIVLDFYGLTCLWDTVIFSGIIPGFAEGDLSLPEDSHLFAVGCLLISHGSLFILTQ